MPRKLKNPERTAWDWFSRWRRLVDADDDGYVKCCTCDSVKYWNEFHAGHFIPQGSSSYWKFEPDNVHAQCNGCNTFQGGRLMEYTLYMIERYGMDRVQELKDKKHKTIKRHEFELYPMIEDFKLKAKTEALARGIKL